MTEFGDPVTTEQATWAILKEIKSPIVGDLEAYSTVAQALQYCMRKENLDCLSGGEQRLVKIAEGVFSQDENFAGSGVAALGGLDRDLRRKVWIILGYLYLGRDILNFDNERLVDMGKFRER
jgi:hypothetical protein